jgi:hypothetical protein
MDRRRVGDIQPGGAESALPVAREELGQLSRLEIGQGNLADSGILEEIVGAGTALQSSTEN